jgi:CHAT domain-containing protein
MEYFNQVADRFTNECSNPRSDLTALKRDGRTLYDWLIEPVKESLDVSRTLTIEPDGLITQLPLQALVDHSQAYLGSRFTVSFSPGITYGQRTHHRVNFSRNLQALIVETSTLRGQPDETLFPLPDAAREAEAVAARFERAQLLRGNRATADAVLEKLTSAEVFHFAGHAIARSERSGLLLAGPSKLAGGRDDTVLLDAERLTTSHLSKCFLVVLSACSTAGPKPETTVNLDNLVGTFLERGVTYVVASRWNVDSSTTASLMDDFYSSLVSGSEVPRALQMAEFNISRKQEFEHPYYWAAFSEFTREDN